MPKKKQTPKKTPKKAPVSDDAELAAICVDSIKRAREMFADAGTAPS
jgi:hypothetical protein